MATHHTTTGLFVLLVALLAVLASAEDRNTSTVDAYDYDCTTATTCSECTNTGFCAWCGNSDTKGYCTACDGNCHKPASCPSKYWTRSICPSELNALALGAGAIVGIVIASVVGCCCLVGTCCLLVYCCCFAGTVALISRKSPGHQGYVVHQNSPQCELEAVSRQGKVVFNKEDLLV